jgi:hypothetical protein
MSGGLLLIQGHGITRIASKTTRYMRFARKIVSSHARPKGAGSGNTCGFAELIQFGARPERDAPSLGRFGGAKSTYTPRKSSIRDSPAQARSHSRSACSSCPCRMSRMGLRRAGLVHLGSPWAADPSPGAVWRCPHQQPGQPSRLRLTPEADACVGVRGRGSLQPLALLGRVPRSPLRLVAPRPASHGWWAAALRRRG